MASQPIDQQNVTLETISAAAANIEDAVARTPCPESPRLSELTGCHVFCKLENLQRTGSFKERGGANALARLSQSRRQRGVIAASAGNHAQAIAYHARRLGIEATVVMPIHAPLAKVESCRRLGAEVVLHGRSFGEARERADALTAERGATYVHGFDDADVIAGQGTIALEVLEQVPNLDAIVVPIGGGGLISGIAVAVAAMAPHVEVIGVEPERAACWTAAVAAGEAVRIETRPTLADGLAVPCVGERAFALGRERVGRVVTVSEESLSLAILRLIEMEKAIVEGAGAASLAALEHPALADLANKTVALMLCGGNIDPLVLRRVIEHGLAQDGRLCRVVAKVSDRPGGLRSLTELIARLGGSIQHIQHDRVFSGPDVSTVLVDCTVETRDASHAAELRAALRDAGLLADTTPTVP